MTDKGEGTSVNVDVIKDFIDSFAKLSPDNQLVLLGMLKGMVMVNDVSEIQRKGA